MIIGFDGSRAFNKHKTGTENYSFQLLQHLSKIDTENNYVIYIRPGFEIEKGWPGNFKFKVLNFKLLWTQVGLALSTFTDPLDVLFVPSHTLPLIRKPGLKTVLTVHDLGAQYLPQYHQLKQRLYLSFVTSQQLSSATKLIAVSQATKDDLHKQIGIPTAKISVIYEGVNHDLKPIKGDILRDTLRQYDLSANNYFLFIGTIQPRKNLERLINAYGKLFTPKAPQLVLAGSRGWLSDEIYKLPAQLKIASAVKFLGYVPDQHLPALYSGATAFVFPSLFEGFGLPVLEAMACRCPVITSNLSSLPEVAGRGAILVDPYSVDDISQAMSKVMNPEFRMKLQEKGFKQVKRFSWEKTARETLQILTQVGRG